MKFEDLHHVYWALKHNNTRKLAFFEKLKRLNALEAAQIIYSRMRHPFRRHRIFREAWSLGVSDKLVLQACRWLIYEERWKNFDFRRLP